MAQRYIYLQDELNNKLKQEENASALITSLLMEHYKYNTQDINEINREIDELREKEKLSGSKIESEMEKLERVKNRVESELKEKAEKLEKAKLWLAEFKNRFGSDKEMEEFVSNASEQLKQKYERAKEYAK